MPPPSSGGAVILQVLKAIEGAEISPALHDPAQLHQLTEALKHAFADRANFMGDPDFVEVPLKQLLSDERAAQVKALFNPEATLDHKRYGGRYAATRDGGTSHFNVLDERGAAVALTTTINTNFGSGFVAGKSGVLLNNEMDDFVAKPGVPNAYGLVGREANAIEAGKKPLSSMSPTLILEGDRVRGMVGASGGPTIITGTLQVALSLIHSHAHVGDIAGAVQAPRIHHQWTPDVLLYDEGFKPETLAALRARGHKLKPWGRFTSVQALWVYDPPAEGGEALLIGASDPSKRGRPSAVR
jgi:gamma-glutamyltranspeptidase/glutathione hydrolase